MDDASVARTLADAYIWGYPTVDCHSVLAGSSWTPRPPEFKAPFNHSGHARSLATPEDRAVVALNVDTPYSYLWMDLRAEPIVVTVPASDEGRYVALELFDLSTYIVGYVSPRTNGSAGGDFLIAGPSWHGAVPDGVKSAFRVPTEIAFACRTQLFDAADMPDVRRIQDGYRARPLSAYGQRPRRRPRPSSTSRRSTCARTRGRSASSPSSTRCSSKCRPCRRRAPSGSASRKRACRPGRASPRAGSLPMRPARGCRPAWTRCTRRRGRARRRDLREPRVPGRRLPVPGLRRAARHLRQRAGGVPGRRLSGGFGGTEVQR